MEEEKKSESSWEEAERLGPYQLHEQVPQSAPGRGELYRATHETSGATALVYKPEAGEDAVPLKDWRVCLISSASSGFIALEVVESPWSLAPNKHVVEALVFLFEGVRKAVGYMARAIPEDYEHRSPWRLGLGVASAAAVCALLFALVRLAPISQTAPVRDEVLAATEKPDSSTSAYLADTTPQDQSVIARPLPREPFKGQKRPPCTRYAEVELIGACWAPHELKAPCPDSLFEYQGKCYIPAFSAKPPPQSLGQ
jgi:hypothetical protein